MKTIYKIEYDGIYTTIEAHVKTDDRANELIENDSDYFETLNEAKKELKRYIKQRICDWRETLQYANSITKSNCTIINPD